MDFLSSLGLSEETILSIKYQCADDVEISQFYLYEDLMKSSIDLMYKIGVKREVIEEILKNDFRIFISGDYYLKGVLSKIEDIKSFVDKLNSNPIQYYDYLY